MARTVFLLLVLLATAAFVYASFQPRLRFADPMALFAGQRTQQQSAFGCVYERIYTGKSRSDVLFLGSSRTNRAINAEQVSQAYGAVAGRALHATVFSTPWTNPEIMYFYFRDYLANNPAPEIAMIELTPAISLPPPVRYVHPLFTDLAPWYLYLDTLTANDIARHWLFAASDFLRLLVRHLDVSLAGLLVKDFRYIVPEGDSCPAGAFTAKAIDPKQPRIPSFEQQMEAELRKVLPELAPDEIGKPDRLLETYAGNAKMTDITRQAIEKFGHLEAGTSEGHFWSTGVAAERSLDYYRRMVQLGEAHNVKIGFYALPELLEPKARRDEAEELARTLNAPVFLIPYRAVKVSYHHYSDHMHVSANFKPVYAAWFAGLIEQLRED